MEESPSGSAVEQESSGRNPVFSVKEGKVSAGAVKELVIMGENSFGLRKGCRMKGDICSVSKFESVGKINRNKLQTADYSALIRGYRQATVSGIISDAHFMKSFLRQSVWRKKEGKLMRLYSLKKMLKSSIHSVLMPREVKNLPIKEFYGFKK